MLVVIAVAVTALTSGAAVAALGKAVGGAVAGATGSVASQIVGVATGIQARFDWKDVALSAISGGAARGLGSLGGSGVTGAVVRGAAGSAVTQGVAMATGLQSRFDWTGVAVGAVVGGVGRQAGNWAADHGLAGWRANTIAGVGGTMAGAAVQSALTRSSFTDNLRAALPSAIGATIGNAIAGGMQQQARRSAETRLTSLDLVPREDTAIAAGPPFTPGDLSRELPSLKIIPSNGGALAQYGLTQGAGTSWTPSDGVVVTDFGVFVDGAPVDGIGAPGDLLAQVRPPPRGSRPGIGHNRPPPENTTLQPAFPGLPNSPGANVILGTVDDLLGGAGWGAVDQALTNQYGYFLGLNRQLDPNYRPGPSLTASPPGFQGREAEIASLRSDLATATYNLQTDTLSFLQESVDLRYNQALREYRSGQLPAGLSQDQAVGSRIDVLMRGDLQAFYRSREVSFGPRQYVTVNNRQYAGDGSYRIPDAQVGRVWFDWTLSPKTASTPQVQGFNAARSNPIGGAIIRPTALGGSYWVAPLPPTRR